MEHVSMFKTNASRSIPECCECVITNTRYSFHSGGKNSASNHSGATQKPSHRLLRCSIWWRLRQPAMEKHAHFFYSHIRNKNPVAVRGNLWYQQGQQHIKQWRTTSLHFTSVNLTITQQKDDNPKNYNKAQNLFKILLGFWIVQRENHNPSYTIHFAPYVNIFK